jgi:23S rRNA G2069 N7-methylase RlmK/C1962 C5-methylase RlmI
MPDISFILNFSNMSNDAQSVLDRFIQWLIGRKVEDADLFLNSLRITVEGEFGEDTGLFLWFDPVWHLGSPEGVLVGSRQAQV